MLKTKKEILNFLKLINININNYSLKQDKENNFLVSVFGDVNISKMNLKEIPIQFDCVDGDFACFQNELTSLISSPRYVGGTFNCERNSLKSLIGSPITIKEHFIFQHNEVQSLLGCSKSVYGDFIGSYNKLKSLKDGPEWVDGDMLFWYNDIQSIEGFKTKFSGYLYHYNNNSEIQELRNYYSLIALNKKKELMITEIELCEIFNKINFYHSLENELDEKREKFKIKIKI